MTASARTPSALVPRRAASVHSRRRWHLIARILSGAFFALVLFAIAWYARTIEWEPVFEALRSYRPATLALAAALAASHCVLYASFDLLTRPHVPHGSEKGRLPWRWVLPVAFTSYTFNLNLGPWIGSLGMRLRQYSRLGIGSAQILRILVFTTLTNWAGYIFLAGLVFAVAPPPVLPEDWPVGAGTLRLVGVGLLAVTAAYWTLCALARRRVYTIHRLSLRLPSFRMALTQTALASTNWLLIALVAWVVLKGAVPVTTMVVTILFASVAGAIVHIPGGVGVIEAVLLAVLDGEVPHGQLVAALLVYRAVYYLWPFALGLLTFAIIENLLRRQPAAAAP